MRKFWRKDKPWQDGQPPYPGFQAYRRMLYHPKLAPDGKVFKTPAETIGLANRGWYDSPGKFPNPSHLSQFLETKAKPWFTKWQWLLAGIAAILVLLAALVKLLQALGSIKS